MPRAAERPEDGHPAGGAGLLASPVRRAIVDTLAHLPQGDRQEGLSAPELGERLSLHPTTIRFHVDLLVAAGLLTSHFVRSGDVGRPRKKYLLHEAPLGDTEQQMPAGSPFEILAGLLTEALDEDDVRRLSPEEAGVRWAQRRVQEARLAPDRPAGKDVTEAVVDLLGEWGYTPSTSPSPDGAGVDITLHDCPFLELAKTHPDVVCGVHRGLLRGALGAVGATDARVSLRPFITATTCRARVHLDGSDQLQRTLDDTPVPAVPPTDRAPSSETRTP